MRTLSRRLALAVGIAIVLSTALYTFRNGSLFDFRSYYCGARAANAGLNPYHFGSLHACDLKLVFGAHGGPGIVGPVPIPGYDFALLGPLARLDPDRAGLLWRFVLIGAYGGTCFALSRATGLGIVPIAGILFTADLAAPLVSGQLPTVVLAFIAASLLAVHRGRIVLGAVLALGTMIEPHIGLGLCITLFLAQSKARLPLACGAAALALVSVLELGLAANVEYLRRTLPAQALAEVGKEQQLSLTALLHVFRVPDAQATMLGSLSYAVLLPTGIIVALRLAARFGPRYAIAVPPVFSLLAGPYVHEFQMTAALPACLLIVADRAQRPARLGLLALPLLAWPWMQVLDSPALLSCACVGLAAALVLEGVALRIIVSVVSAAVIATAVLVGRMRPSPEMTSVVVPFPVTSDTDASLVWRVFVDATSHANLAVHLLAKIPTWTALVLLVVVFASDGIKSAGGKRTATLQAGTGT